MNRVVQGFLLAALCAACSTNNQPSYNAPAPKNNSETGFIVESSKAAVDELLMTYGGSARVLRVENGVPTMFEVFGLSETVIRHQLGRVEITKNVYFDNIVPGKSLSAQALAEGSETSVDLKECKLNADQPTAEVGLLDHVDEMMKSATIEVGETITFTGEPSQPHPDHDGKLKFAWGIQPPPKSNHEEAVVFGKKMKLTPDALGRYDVLLLVQDERDVCHVKTVSFLVTDNPDFTANGNLRALEKNKHDYLEAVEALAAHAITRGEDVIIAVIDTGVHYNHPDLAGNIYENSHEIPDNGIDDDGNGKVDDAIGWDFVYDDKWPFDDQGHGSHVAGLAASPIFGVAPDAKIMPLKALNGAGGGDVASAMAAVYYAADAGVHVINGSFGSMGETFRVLEKAIEYASSKGVLFVAAAGNGHPQTGIGLNIDHTPVYPAALELDNLVTVAALDLEKDDLTFYSNFGIERVHVAAPGGTPEVPLLSATNHNPKGTMLEANMGTSMASPIVAGVAALILSESPGLAPKDVKEILVKAGKKLTKLKNSVQSGRIVSALDAVRLAQSHTPSFLASH